MARNFVTVTISVPEEHVAALYEHAARLQRGDESEAQRIEAAAPRKPTPELIREIYRESNDRHRRFLRLLAEEPGRWVAASAVTEALGISSKGLGGMLGGFGRRLHHRHGDFKPWKRTWHPEPGENRYWMSPEVAEWVLEAAEVET